MISFHLKKAGCQVTTAENGKIAYDEATVAVERGEPFDIIFMDMQMPVMDGYQAASKLREAEYQGPICALTAHAMNGDREKCINAGCDDYLTKPIDVDKLISAVRKSWAGEVAATGAVETGYDPGRVVRLDQTPAGSMQLPPNLEADTAKPEATVASLEIKQPCEPSVEETIHNETAKTVQEPTDTGEARSMVADAGAALVKTSKVYEPLVSDFSDDPDMLEIIEMFVDGLGERIDSILTAFDDRNFTAVSGIAHQLKGASGGYGYPSLSDLAFDVEQLARKNRYCPMPCRKFR